MQMMIVSSDRSAVRAIKTFMSASAMGRSEIFSAGSTQQAETILKVEEISLLVLDLDLSEPVLSFLSSVSLRSGAFSVLLIGGTPSAELMRAALRLKVCDYLPKPLSEDAIGRALCLLIDRQKERIAMAQEERFAAYWKENRVSVQELFWKNLCLGRMTNRPELIKRRAENCGIQIDEDGKYALVLISIKNIEEVTENWGNELCETAIQNLARGLIKGDSHDSQVIVIYTRVVIILGEQELPLFQERAAQLVEKCRTLLSAEILCYISERIFCEEMAETYAGLLRFSKDDVLCQERVRTVEKAAFYRGEKERKKEEPVKLPEEWAKLVESEQTEALVGKMRSFLTALARKNRLDERNFRILQQDLLQMFFTAMEQKELKAHQLYENEAVYQYYKTAVFSIDGMCLWIRNCMDLLKRLTERQKSGPKEQIAARIKAIIKADLKTEINRERLMKELNLNPDYINRVFKQETGETVKGYTIRKRMAEAQRLLKDTELPISEVALQVGYDNFSHFIRMFRKETGYTPRKYKQEVAHPKTAQADEETAE